jgi:ribosomal protein L12E/L44/L45/RPP1/RPP2
MGKYSIKTPCAFLAYCASGRWSTIKVTKTSNEHCQQNFNYYLITIMVQDQLVEYITSQLKAGVSGETIKATLVAAGWQSVDVDDTLKKIQSPAVAAAQPMAVSASSPSAMATGPKPISTAKIEPQTIRVSDLVSASDKVVSMSATKPIDTRAESTKKFLTPNVAPGATSYQAPAVRSSSRGPITTEILLGILMIVFGALAVYLFLANRGLSGQVSMLTAQSTGVSTQVSTLQNQLDASTTALTAEVASATTANQELALDLSFYAIPTGSATTPTSTTMLVGLVSGSTGSYVITTPNGARVRVLNSKDPKVATLMSPLVGATTTVPFGGTYTPGIAAITLTEVNGVSLIAPPAVSGTPTSTASSTGASAAPMIPAPAPTPTSPIPPTPGQ